MYEGKRQYHKAHPEADRRAEWPGRRLGKASGAMGLRRLALPRHLAALGASQGPDRVHAAGGAGDEPLQAHRH